MVVGKADEPERKGLVSQPAAESEDRLAPPPVPVNKLELEQYDTPELAEAFSTMRESAAEEEKIKEKFPWKTLAAVALIVAFVPAAVMYLFFR